MCALVTGVQTFALPICVDLEIHLGTRLGTGRCGRLLGRLPLDALAGAASVTALIRGRGTGSKYKGHQDQAWNSQSHGRLLKSRIVRIRSCYPTGPSERRCPDSRLSFQTHGFPRADARRACGDETILGMI